MKILSINSANFKGLWEISKPRENGRIETKEGSIPVLERKAIYHPFSDEADNEVKEAMSDVTTAYEAVYKGAVDHFILTKHSLGERLNLTKDAYEKISNMKKDDTLVYKHVDKPYLSYRPTIISPDIAKH